MLPSFLCRSRVQSDGKMIREAELVGTRASYMHVLASSVTCYLDDRIKHKPHILSAPREVHDRKKISIHLSQKNTLILRKKAPSAHLRRASCPPISKENVPSRTALPPYGRRGASGTPPIARSRSQSLGSHFSQSVSQSLGRPLGGARTHRFP